MLHDAESCSRDEWKFSKVSSSSHAGRSEYRRHHIPCLPSVSSTTPIRVIVYFCIKSLWSSSLVWKGWKQPIQKSDRYLMPCLSVIAVFVFPDAVSKRHCLFLFSRQFSSYYRELVHGAPALAAGSQRVVSTTLLALITWETRKEQNSGIFRNAAAQANQSLSSVDNQARGREDCKNKNRT